MHPTSTKRRMQPKQEHVISRMREWIVNRRLKPGTRLPSRAEIGKQLDVSSLTVQQAFDRLAADGFVESFGRRGTFIADRPPHLSRCGIVFASSPDSPDWSQFWAAMLQATADRRSSDEWDMPFFFNVNQLRSGDDYERLIDDIEQARLAGVVLTNAPHELYGTPILDDKRLARAIVTGGSHYSDAVSVYPETNTFIDRALERLAERGRRRVAFISAMRPVTQFEQYASAGVERLGMEVRPSWFQFVHPGSVEGAAGNVARLLLDRPAPERPDAIVITDDNIVEQATIGIAASGVRLPDDLDIVALCNFPTPPPSVVPVTRLGFDARAIMAVALDGVASLVAGKGGNRQVAISARFEHELNNGPHAAS